MKKCGVCAMLWVDRRKVTAMKYIRIGKIVNTRGIRGELKIIPETSFKEERFLSERPVYLETDGQKEPYHVKKMREFKGYDTVLFEDYEDINRAERLVGKIIWAEDVDVPLDEDVFHVKNVIGMRIIQAGEEKGMVRNVITYPQGDYLDVRRSDGTHAKIPFSDVFVLDVDEADETIEIADMEGLI